MFIGLYAISDERLTPNNVLLEKAEAALKGGATLFQLRHKSATDEELLPLAKDLKKLCEEYNALFIVNDRVNLALKSGAHGLHMGKDDGEFSAARSLLGNKVAIGVSCYGDIERAEAMQAAGADYVAFGSFFTSPTKPTSAVIPIATLKEAKRRLTLPICAIGGLTLHNSSEIIAAGADMIAVVSDLWRATDITKHAQEFVRLFNKS